MPLPLQITFRGMEPSPAVEWRIREKAVKLERFCDRIAGLRVVVDAPHRRHSKGRLYTVRVDLTVPGREILARKGVSQNHAHEDVHVAIRDAFNAAARQLENGARRRRGDAKPSRSAHDRSRRTRTIELVS